MPEAAHSPALPTRYIARSGEPLLLLLQLVAPFLFLLLLSTQLVQAEEEYVGHAGANLAPLFSSFNDSMVSLL